MTKIKFGTDGWRAIIAQEFTFENLARVSQGVANVLKKEIPERDLLIFGYDRRFLSKEFAQSSAAVFANAGFKILFCNSFFPTPGLSWAAKNMPKAAGAIVITASHNPPTYNGFKFKEFFGGSALSSTTTRFEEEINNISPPPFSVYNFQTFASLLKSKKVSYIDLAPDYAKALETQVDKNLIAKKGFKVAIDNMYGSASGHFTKLLEHFGAKVHTMRSEENPNFGGTAPEPTETNIAPLCEFVGQNSYHCGFANDGDADRLAAVDENGKFFSTQKILSLVYWHMLKNREKSWSVARSASTTRMVDLLAQRFGKQSFETPVGFKFIAEKIVVNDAQIGGEESGGIGIIDHLPERDGFLTALLLLELQAMTGKGLAALYSDLCSEVRPYEFERLDLHVEKSVMDQAMNRLKENPPEEWMNRKVSTLSTIDGYKFYLEDGSWLLIRPSGTEPLFRIYAETESLEASAQLVREARRFVERA